MNKSELRKKMQVERKAFSPFERVEKNKKVMERLLEEPSLKTAKNIFVFVSFGEEVNTHILIQYLLRQGKQVCVPKVISKATGMKAIAISSLEELQETPPYGILEPVHILEEISPKEIDLILVPGLAFDPKGGRLGYGGGFYDRFLKEVKEEAEKIALAYDFQVVAEVPKDAQDVLVDKIITEKKVYDALK